MVELWENIQEPKTLKETLELLTVIRTNMDLRNQICSILIEMINEDNHTPDPSRIGSFHDLLDLATELRTRIIGVQNFDYGVYKSLKTCRKNLHVCKKSSDACRNVGNRCFANFYHCADAIADILVVILPKLYFTLLAFLAKLNDDDKWLAQQCSNSYGVLHKWLTDKDDLHLVSKDCPYYKVDKLRRGYVTADIKTNDPGYKFKNVIFELVENYGCLRILIITMKNGRYGSYVSSSEMLSRNLEQDCNKCKCRPPKATVKARVKPITKGQRLASYSNGRVPRIKGRESKNDALIITEAIPKKKADEQATTNGTRSNAPGTVSTVAGSESQSRSRRSLTSEFSAGPVTPTVPPSDSGPNTQAITSPSPSLADVPQTGSGHPKNGVMYFSSPSSSYSSHTNPTFLETRIHEVRSGDSGSNSAACGAAAGLLAVGCVGVGAAYVFDIGGFGTMVNGMF
ncbi:cell division protein FtsK [Babesia caballi]|uniref:Cell division protein FtsK n=1 Tax=Babesia caballi TaxID=5871 RepID=A0AAV4M3K8_BABCB|nr:cell division protein FtsK [Babesia caballi]